MGLFLSPYGSRGRPKSPKPKEEVIVFLVDKETKREWESFQQYVTLRKKPKHKQDILRFMIASSYNNLG